MLQELSSDFQVLKNVRYRDKKIHTDGYNVMQIKSFIAFYTWAMI